MTVSPRLKAGAKRAVGWRLSCGTERRVVGTRKLYSQKSPLPRMSCHAAYSSLLPAKARDATTSFGHKVVERNLDQKNWDFPGFILHRQLPSTSPL